MVHSSENDKANAGIENAENDSIFSPEYLNIVKDFSEMKHNMEALDLTIRVEEKNQK